MRKVELLAPAGNMECLKAAVSGGCNAVYLGLKTFSARAFAGNFSHEEFIEAIDYCHTRGVKVYCTINTMLSETEIENAKIEVDFLYENDCDAILVQDLGLFEYIRTCYPDFPIHCSTQMHIHNLKGVDWMKKEGVERVVMARETPIEIIREACKTGMEIEVFVYGAICISYSGECMMSEAMKNRSANKGMCAQCCRLRYFKEDGTPFEKGDYVLSPKDLNTLSEIDALIEAGVTSFKIEGRMKRKEYVYLVTKTYRQAIDAYYRGEKYHISTERMKELECMFNREFSLGHLFHASSKERMNPFRPNHQGIVIGKVESYKNGKVEVRLCDTLYQHDGLRIINEPHDTGLTAVKIYKNGKLVNRADANDVVVLECKSKPVPKKGQILRKTTDARLIKRVDEKIIEEPVLIPVTIEYEAKVGKTFILKVKDEENHTVQIESDEILEAAQKAPVTHEMLVRSFAKRGEYPFFVKDIHGVLEDIFLPVSNLNKIRREAFEALYTCRKKNRVNQGKKEYTTIIEKPEVTLKQILVQGDLQKEDDDMIMYLNEADMLPVVDENNCERQTHGNKVLGSVCDLNNDLKDCIAGMSMNIANSYAIAYVLKHGSTGVVFSSELNNAQILSSLKAFEERYGFMPAAYRLVYGKRTVMYIKDKIDSLNGLDAFTDLHGERYELLYNNGITMIREPHAYVEKNPYCYGSYVILDEKNKKKKEILEECYEEIFRRI